MGAKMDTLTIKVDALKKMLDEMEGRLHELTIKVNTLCIQGTWGIEDPTPDDRVPEFYRRDTDARYRSRNSV
jgi:hypothetical protein